MPAKASLAVHERTGQVAGQFVQLRVIKIGEGGTQDFRYIDPGFLQSGNDSGSDSPPPETGLPTGPDQDKRIEDLHAPSLPWDTARLRVTSLWPCISCFRRIEAEMAAKQQQQEAAAAERKRQEEEARQKAEAERANLRQAEEANQKVVEAGELSLHLTAGDRHRIQVALTALGFDTRGADGVFGALTRERIAAWQKARGLASTGFVTGEQTQALLKEAAPALSRFDDERRKLNKTAADESGRAGAPVPPAAPPAAAPAPATSLSQAIIVQSEPPAGSLRQGQVILVDDGTCPVGQIKEVTGGRSNERVQRTRRCIPRPRN